MLHHLAQIVAQRRLAAGKRDIHRAHGARACRARPSIPASSAPGPSLSSPGPVPRTRTKEPVVVAPPQSPPAAVVGKNDGARRRPPRSFRHSQQAAQARRAPLQRRFIVRLRAPPSSHCPQRNPTGALESSSVERPSGSPAHPATAPPAPRQARQRPPWAALPAKGLLVQLHRCPALASGVHWASACSRRRPSSRFSGQATGFPAPDTTSFHETGHTYSVTGGGMHMS